MKISFVIPAYNEEARIGACLEAIRREVARTGANAEIIVANNASTDGTRRVAEAAGARVVDEPRKGITWARQAGYMASSGELIANIDADVRLTPGWLSTVLARFEKNPELVALSGPFIYDDLSAWARLLTRIFYGLGLMSSHASMLLEGRGAMLQGGNFVLRRNALEKIGGFNTDIEFYGEDSDMARRIATQGTVEWTFDLPVYSSGRRLKQEGVLRTGAKYAANHWAVSLTGKPVTNEYKDIRPE
jgi:glycosyltransferase involved in cell wall biosynthesis